MSEHVKLSEVCEILNSNVDKKIKENEQKVKLCNFTDVYNNWAITKYTSKKFMKATATQNEINKFSLKQQVKPNKSNLNKKSYSKTHFLKGIGGILR